jgi:hypothetical protein
VGIFPLKSRRTENDSPPEQPREQQPPGTQPNEQEREKQQGQATEKGA